MDRAYLASMRISESAAALIDVKYNTSPDTEVAARVDEAKRLAARLVTLLEPAQAKRAPMSGRLASAAITDIEKAAMLVVKALTRSDAP